MSMINKCNVPILHSLMVVMGEMRVENSLKGVGSGNVLVPTTLIVVKSNSKWSISAPYTLYSTSFEGI